VKAGPKPVLELGGVIRGASRGESAIVKAQLQGALEDG
jgi:hypothetical protein